MIYVDDLFPTKRTSSWHYDQACHLSADTDEELHAFALKLGLRRSWAQHMDHHFQLYHHYDLTPNKRAMAVRLGATEVSALEQARTFWATQKKPPQEFDAPQNL